MHLTSFASALLRRTAGCGGGRRSARSRRSTGWYRPRFSSFGRRFSSHEIHNEEGQQNIPVSLDKTQRRIVHFGSGTTCTSSTTALSFVPGSRWTRGLVELAVGPHAWQPSQAGRRIVLGHDGAQCHSGRRRVPRYSGFPCFGQIVVGQLRLPHFVVAGFGSESTDQGNVGETDDGRFGSQRENNLISFVVCHT